jgi:hypothetical protein
MLMIEGVKTQKDAPEGKNQIALNQITRYGIQIVNNIGISGEKKLEFKKTKLVKDAGKRVLEEDLENIGERWLTPVLWVELYDKSGALQGRFPGGNARIYPQTSVRFKADLSTVKEGEYKALIIADCGGEDVYGISSKLKISDIEEKMPKQVSAPAPLSQPQPVPIPQSQALPRSTPVPWAFISVLAVVLLALSQKKRVFIVFNRAAEFIHAVSATPQLAPALVLPAVKEPVQAKKRMAFDISSVDVFESINVLVDDAHILALNSEAIAARVNVSHATAGDYREELKSLVMAAIDSLDYTVSFIEGYLNQDKTERADSGQTYQVMQTVIDNYNKVADTMSFVAHATKLINQPMDKTISQKQLFSQADALRDMAGKLKQVVGA